MTTKIHWRCRDILDLEYILKEDEQKSEEERLDRDREIYREKIAPCLAGEVELVEGGDGKKNSSRMIRIWLDEMKNNGENRTLPGTWFDKVMALVTPLFLVLGLGVGLSLCAPFFAYTGTRPVNVSYLFCTLVVVQVFLLVFMVLSMVLKPSDSRFFIGLYDLVALAVQRMIMVWNRQVHDRLSGETRLALLASIGLIRSGSRRYSRIFFWPIFNLMQLFGIGVNLGILTIILFRVFFFDTAFGWQSTLQVGSDFMYRAVTIVSLPWSWFIPLEIAHPSLAEIEGSRMILKEGVFFLTTRDLISWWPFLLFSVLFYGFIPRFLSWVWGNVRLGRALDQISFDTAQYQFLIQRFLTPRVKVDSQVSMEPETHESLPISQEKFLIPGDFMALIPEEIFFMFDTVDFVNLIRDRLGIQVSQMESMGLDPDKDEHIVSSFLEKSERGVLLILEAWQPPIRETLRFISFIRRSGEKSTPLMVGLIGKPGGDGPITHVESGDLALWIKTIQSLGDPLVRTTTLVIS